MREQDRVRSEFTQHTLHDARVREGRGEFGL
jgi:hypothetical protein